MQHDYETGKNFSWYVYTHTPIELSFTHARTTFFSKGWPKMLSHEHMYTGYFLVPLGGLVVLSLRFVGAALSVTGT